jgi:uncharacterized delta-60 repeat protein
MKRRSMFGLAGVVAAAVLASATVVPGSAATATSPGSLDPSFGTRGISQAKFSFPGVAHDAVLLANGDILVGGDFGVARFRPDGKLDTTFGTGGFGSAGFNTIGEGGGWLAVQADGKIVWVGTTADSTGGTFKFAVARFNATGTLDAAFGNAGQATVEFFAPPLQGAQEFADAVVIQPDGKILVAGSARQGQNKFAPIQGALVRLNSNGTSDRSFGNGGQALSGGQVGRISALGLDQAGDIFALPAHAEFSPSGQLDANTTAAPITISSHGNADAFLASGQTEHGATVGVARRDVDVQVQRFTANGSVVSSSSTFDFSGASGLDQARDSAAAVAIQPNGQTVLAGSRCCAVIPAFGLARVNADGSLDSTFGSGGVVTTNIPSGFGYLGALIQPDGKIIALGGGTDNSTGQTEIILARYFG